MTTAASTRSENDDGVEFGVSKLGETLVPLHAESATEIATQLENAVLEFTSLQALADDLTLVVVSRGAVAN